VVPKYLSLGVELHYQRYFLGPNSIKTAPATVDNVSMAGGVRFHVPIAGIGCAAAFPTAAAWTRR
jgi:hypothetical protein